MQVLVLLNLDWYDLMKNKNMEEVNIEYIDDYIVGLDNKIMFHSL